MKRFAIFMLCAVLVGCNKKEIDVQLDSTQVVTTKETQTVRETTLEWRSRMEQAPSIYVPIE